MSTEVAKVRLWDLAEQQRALLDTEEGGISPEDAEAFALSVRKALLESAAKVDAYAELLDMLAAKVEAARGIALARKQQAKEKEARAARLESSMDQLGQYILLAIRELGKDPKSKTGAYRKLEGETVTFQGNKLAPSCEINDMMLIPEAFKVIQLSTSMPLEDWRALHRDGKTPPLSDVAFNVVDYSIDKGKLLDALKAPCSRCCDGSGVQGVPVDDSPACQACNGAGTQRIPGALLLSDRLRLVVK